MKRLISQFAIVLSFCVLGVGSAAAQCLNSNNLCLTGVGNGNSLDGIYVSPYVATVNGVVSTYVICDDFEDEVTTNESWTATSGTVGDPSTNGLFGSLNSTGYAQVAWLAGQLITNLPTLTSYQQDLLSYSIWSVFDPGTAPTPTTAGTGVQGWLDANPGGGLTWAAVQQEVALAPTSGNFSDVTVYTPVAGTETCCGRPQEFLTVSTPEAPATANLAVDFLGLGVVLFAFRRYRFAGR